MTSTEQSDRKKSGPFRFKAIVPLTLVLAIIVLAWILLADKAVERGVEIVGTRLVGARVDVESASIKLSTGEVRLRGMQVTNPDSPMRNLFQVDEIVGNLGILAALEQKVVIDTLAVRGMRFGTAREESGALPVSEGDSTAGKGLIMRQVEAWAADIRGPELSFDGLTDGLAGLRNLSPDSLATVRAARTLIESARTSPPRPTEFLESLRVPAIRDSSRALLSRLQGQNVASLGVSGARNAVTSLQSNVSAIDGALSRLNAADSVVTASFAPLTSAMAAFPDLRQQDYQLAARQLNLPRLDTPDLSLSVFGQAVADQLRPILYYVRLAEQYLPPGLDPRRRPGPSRVRMAGTDVEFPRRNVFPKFLIEYTEVSLSLDSGAAAGSYLARATGLTSQPAVHGRPLELVAGREAAGGIGNAALSVLIDHVQRPLRDTLGFQLSGVSLPSVTIPGLGARMPATPGNLALALTRRGDSIRGGMSWSASGINWELPEVQGTGLQARVLTGLSSVIGGLSQIDLEVDVNGLLNSPGISVRSNVGRVIATEIRNQVGAEVRRLEAQARARVDSLVQPQIQRARSTVDSLRTDFTGRIEQERSNLNQLKSDLEARARALVPSLPRLPGG